MNSNPTPSPAAGSKSPKQHISDLLFDIGYGVGEYPPEVLVDGIHAGYTDYCADRLIELIAAQNNATYEAIREVLDGLEVDREATEEHIRSKLDDEDEINRQILNMNIEADDQHDLLNELRQSIAKIFGKEGDL